jgi:hypothetical protein
MMPGVTAGCIESSKALHVIQKEAKKPFNRRAHIRPGHDIVMFKIYGTVSILKIGRLDSITGGGP